MSTFMEHIHRDIDTLELVDDDVALGRPVEYDLAPTDNGEPVGGVTAHSHVV